MLTAARLRLAQEALRADHARCVAVTDSLDATVYVADMQTHELLFANQRVREQFGDVVGNVCWKSIQTGQPWPCNFCTNGRLRNADGRPAEPELVRRALPENSPERGMIEQTDAGVLREGGLPGEPT